MTLMERYRQWVSSPILTPDERAELLAMADDPREIEDRFFAPLEFGTAGLRGVLGMGLRRMNVYVVRQTTQALANLILSEGGNAPEKGVAIAYDSRHFSGDFAHQAACVLAANGIHVKLFDACRPTPELSFAIRAYGCTAGINITASHNPKEYNGYKVYWSDGAQLPPRHADVVAREMERLDLFVDSRFMPWDEAQASGLITMLGEAVDREFLECVLSQSVSRQAVLAVAEHFKIVYTPFHGTGHFLVPEALRKLGFTHILCEPEQMRLDGDFPTVASPNPENKESFARAIALAQANDVDLIIGTDPDADRVGVVVRDETGGYITLTGNQIGVLLLDYIIRARKEQNTMPENPAAIKTIVTTEMVRAIGHCHGVDVFDTFTGFKFIAERIASFEEKQSHHFLLGFEESYGYLAGDFARDKDAVTASMLIAEMAAWYCLQGKSLYAAMRELYRIYGYYRELTLNVTLPGVDGLHKMKALMDGLRAQTPAMIADTQVLAVRDYLTGRRRVLSESATQDMELSGSNVLCFEMPDGTNLLVRPSGTEPKVKVYILAQGQTEADCERKVKAYAGWVGRRIPGE